MAAGDKYAKTEKPTPKRKKEAREKGQVARSPDLNAWIAVLAASVLAPWFVSTVRSQALAVTAAAVNVMGHPTPPGAMAVLEQGLKAILLCAALVGSSLMAIGVFVSAAQVGNAASFKAARPRFSKLNPKSGLQRLFSPRVGWELAKQLLKLAVLVVLAYSGLHGLIDAIAGKQPAELLPLVDYAGGALLSLARIVAIVSLAIAGADYAYQRHQTTKSIMMTKQEVKDEHKAQEGDPQVKSKLRRQQYSIARSKAISAVKTADVLVANPTHFAVAIQYDPKRSRAPRVVAKGMDSLALRMREEAAVHAVPVVEDPPLARYLHAVCDVDQPIPPTVYVAVARLIAFVYSLSPQMRAIGIHRRPYSVVPEVDPGAPPPAVAATRRRQAAALARRR